jgi:hypothetical protein
MVAVIAAVGGTGVEAVVMMTSVDRGPGWLAAL